ncbi:hypothetical protein E2C01_079505 [Portunus trituberculatus]|uniref:Uncharacterized protein n=1 Tax=Portunus trituberculatus TaxID=210409 RepID=A0A5B7ISY1_PORTR|nr:hypothetical protein [Portunus trituberculatus]
MHAPHPPTPVYLRDYMKTRLYLSDTSKQAFSFLSADLYSFTSTARPATPALSVPQGTSGAAEGGAARGLKCTRLIYKSRGLKLGSVHH